MNEPGQDITVIPNYEIGMVREPNTVLAEAKVAAQALMTVVKQKPKPVIMNGEQYLEFEDWQTVAKFYGLTAKVTRTTFIDFGGVKGFEATAEVLRLSDGMTVSAADAMCLNDEDKWSTRTKYEYVNGVKTKTGEVPVPLFQLRSMAQTRACAKALRNVLAWVVVLAGFKPTPAEEMTGTETAPKANGKPEVHPPQAAEPAQAPKASGNATDCITEPQRKRLLAIGKGSGYDFSEIETMVKEKYGCGSSSLPKSEYEAVVEFFKIQKGA